MKRLFTILTVFALTITTSFAQIGIKLGANLANISFNDAAKDLLGDDNGMKLGFIFGANYRADLSDAMSLDVSATYRQSGSKFTNTVSTTSSGITQKVEDSQKVSLDYLDISTSFSFNLSDQFLLSVGPYIAFAVGGKFKTESTVTVSGGSESMNGAETTSIEEDIKFGTGDDDDLKGSDFGINIGATYFINEVMSVTAGYSLGLTNLLYWKDETKKAFDEVNEDLPSITNSGIYIGIGYSFGDSY